MLKQNFFLSTVGFLAFFIVSLTAIQTVSAAMCGADNSGSCQVACNGGQTSIVDSTGKCTGALNGSGGTVCCSPANVLEWPASQCQALGGANAIGGNGCDDIQNTFDAGIYLTVDCNASGRCCLPSGTFNNSNPLPNPQACNAKQCTDPAVGGQCLAACTTGLTPAAGICGAGTQCCIAGGGGSCESQGGTCMGSLTQTCTSLGRVSASGSCTTPGQSCCGAPISTSAPVGKLNYTLLEQIPGSLDSSGDMALYLKKLYNFTFWAIGVAALFMLTIGGFMYVTSAGNTSRIDTAKTIITDSLLGIIVALFAWLFLYVINPDLVEGLTLPGTVKNQELTGGSGGGGVQPAPTTDARSMAQQILAGGTGISLNQSGSCASASGTAISPQFTLSQVAAGVAAIRCQNGCPGNGACTQTTTLNQNMLQAMLEVAKQYPFTVTSITGGSHCEAGVSGCKGLSAHYAGNAIDISTGNKADWPAIVEAFRKQNSNPGQTFCDKSGTPLPPNRCNEANHIHVAF